MKKFILVLMGCAVLGLFTACQSTTSSKANTSINVQNEITQPDRKPDIYAQIRSVKGNELALNLVEVKEDMSELSEEEKQKRREEMQSLSEEERKKSREERNKLTGETATITIPVGTPVCKNDFSDGKTTYKELELSELREGLNIRVWLDKQGTDGDKTAEFVLVTQSQQ